MRVLALFAFLGLVAVDAFQSTSLSVQRQSVIRSYAYVPDGLTAEQYKKIKEKELQKAQNLGSMGPRGFKSRSFQSFQEALERGETTHLMPVLNAKARIAKGELKVEDIPYMQRGGAWDNSDVKGAKKVKWLSSDKEYANGGFRKEQSVSIFGTGVGLDWTGARGRSGPAENIRGKAIPKPKNYKAPNVNDLVAEDKPKKGLFGMW